MSEPDAAIVETPTEEQITQQYIEARLDGKTDDLPVPPPTIAEVIPAPSEPTEPPPPTPEVAEIAKTDTYIEERKDRKDVKRKRAGKQTKIDERIDQLTKEKVAAEEKAAALEAEKAHAPIPPGTIPNATPDTLQPTPPVVPVPDSESRPRPRMNEFTDADEYHAAMAQWALDERDRIRGVPKVEQPVPIPAPASQITKESFDRFLEKGKIFIAGHPDFNTTLEAAHVRGLTMSEGARLAITDLAAPEVVYWLAKPENDLAARSLMAMSESRQIAEVGRISERLAVSPSDFVSRAPVPGIRLQGSGFTQDVPMNQITDTDEYIRRRRQERRDKRGRR